MRIWIVCAVLLAGITAFAQAGDMPGPDAEALWTYITKTDPYCKWEYWPDHQGMQPGRSPHGPMHEIRVNHTAMVKGHPKQAGAIVIKDNFSKEKKLLAVTVMYKIQDYNPMAGDWFWVKYGPDGTVLKAGKPKGCIACHGSRADMDYIMVSDH